MNNAWDIQWIELEVKWNQQNFGNFGISKKQKFATIIKNAEILRFVLDHRKAKKMCTKVVIEVANSNKVCSWSI